MTRRRNIDEELKISYTKMALNWCVENLGVNRRKRKKLILEINDKDFSQSRIIYNRVLFIDIIPHVTIILKIHAKDRRKETR